MELNLSRVAHFDCLEIKDFSDMSLNARVGLDRLPGPDNSLYFRGLKLSGPGVATTYTQHTEV